MKTPWGRQEVDGETAHIIVLSCSRKHFQFVPFIHPSIVVHISGVRLMVVPVYAGYSRRPSTWQQSPAPAGGSQSVPRPNEINNPFQRVLDLPWCLLTSLTCPNRQRKAPRWPPDKKPKPPQLVPLDVKEQKLYSKFPSDVPFLNSFFKAELKTPYGGK